MRLLPELCFRSEHTFACPEALLRPFFLCSGEEIFGFVWKLPISNWCSEQECTKNGEYSILCFLSAKTFYVAWTFQKRGYGARM